MRFRYKDIKDIPDGLAAQLPCLLYHMPTDQFRMIDPDTWASPYSIRRRPLSHRNIQASLLAHKTFFEFAFSRNDVEFRFIIGKEVTDISQTFTS